jgi:Tol biopolymer transport system component
MFILTSETKTWMREENTMILMRSIAFVFMICLLGFSGLLLSQNASALFEQGLLKENGEGDLNGAMAVFRQIVQDQAADPSVRAKAQLHIGMCYEKLGLHDAQAAYQKVINGYPQQHQEVALARERMARLVAALKEDTSKPTFRKIHFPNKITWDAQLSPDGKSIALVNNGQLWIVPTSSKLGPGYPGTPRQLDTQGIKIDWPGLTWSADGRWIAFNGEEVEKGYQRIYIVSADGGKPRQAHENNRDARVVNYRMSLSPHGQALAFASVDANELHIYSLSVDGGSPKKLIDAPAREPVFSPDGKMIAYVEDKDLGRAGGGLWVVPADGGVPTRVADAGNASSPVWSPDRRMLAFVDYAAGNQIHILRLKQDGTSADEKVAIDCPEGISEVTRLAGWTPDNEIGAVCKAPTEFALYTQPVKGGKATFVTHGAYPMQPRWSPDGKRIFHVNKAGKASGDWQDLAIAYAPAEGGEVTTVPLKSETKIRLWAYGTGNRVSPDGNTIVFAGQKPQEGPHRMHIWTLPVGGGAPRQLSHAPAPFSDWYPSWSPDGQSIVFMRATSPENWAGVGGGNIYIVRADGGEPRQITSESDRVFDAAPVLWSPDGTLLAYFSRDKDDAADGTLKVIPAGGGEPRVVAKVQRIYANKEMAWSPDGKRIAYNAFRPDNKIKIVSLDDGSIEAIEPDLKDVKEIYHLDWSPDGKTLVFGGYTGGGPEFWTVGNFLPLAHK